MGLFFELLSILLWGAKPPTSPCPGPLIWYDVDWGTSEDEDGNVYRNIAAVIKCHKCSYIVTTGNFQDTAHLNTPILRNPEDGVSGVTT